MYAVLQAGIGAEKPNPPHLRAGVALRERGGVGVVFRGPCVVIGLDMKGGG